jgi:hypothetical protein
MLALFLSLFAITSVNADCLNLHHNGSLVSSRGPSPCVTFSVGAGTGCAWMCSYCAQQLGTNNYYFTDGVCKYQTGGCAGSPQSGVQYTCCAV